MRKRECIDSDWLFQKGDYPGAEQPEYACADWRPVSLPHDWSIEGEYGQDHGTDWQSGYLPAGVGWYRKTLEWQPDWAGRQLSICFDGIYLNSDVWINGHHLGHRPNGYVSFAYDLTPYLKAHQENVLAVKVDHSKAQSGRWYTGSGIYRHVWLVSTSQLHVERHGTFITTPHIQPESAIISLQTTVVNQSAQTHDISLVTVIKDHTGSVAAQDRSDPVSITPSNPSKVIQQTIQIDKPLLWSTDHPTLYVAESMVVEQEKIRDNYSTNFGIRSLEFSSECGFKLNGNRLKMKGVCEHHTAGCLGAAVPDDALRRKLCILKEMGCNAIRTSHNPQAPEFYDFCDEMGILVIDEFFDGWDTAKARDDYGNYFDEWWDIDLTETIKRDRNHPSVVLWSIGNEVSKPTVAVQQKLIDRCIALDGTRPVTQGGHDPTRGMVEVQLSNNLTIKGFNGNGEEQQVLETYHKMHPDQPIIGTEIPHTYATRGVYRTKTHWRRRDFPAPWETHYKGEVGDLMERIFPIPDLTATEVFPEEDENRLFYQSSYDNATVRISARKCWQRVRDFDFMIGQFRWTGFDYLGESNRWPSRFANFGVIDTCGFPKDPYYLYQSLWTDDPMVHMLPHWTHPGKEGTEIPIVVYTNCDTVELFLNDESLGIQSYNDEQLVWLVPYQPGEITAVACKDGKPTAHARHVTAGNPYRVNATVEKNTVLANETDILHVTVDIVDQAGNFVPHASNTITFEIKGAAKLVGTDNGDPLDLSPYKINTRRCFRGKCLAVFQVTGTGDIEIICRSGGLKTARVRAVSVPMP
jgi:beta-galactosidase